MEIAAENISKIATGRDIHIPNGVKNWYSKGVSKKIMCYKS